MGVGFSLPALLPVSLVITCVACLTLLAASSLASSLSLWGLSLCCVAQPSSRCDPYPRTSGSQLPTGRAKPSSSVSSPHRSASPNTPSSIKGAAKKPAAHLTLNQASRTGPLPRSISGNRTKSGLLPQRRGFAPHKRPQRTTAPSGLMDLQKAQDHSGHALGARSSGPCTRSATCGPPRSPTTPRRLVVVRRWALPYGLSTRCKVSPGNNRSFPHFGP
jgi:hypothetical protein